MYRKMEHSSTFYSFVIFNIISNKNGVQNVFELYTVERLSTIKNTDSLQLYNLLKLGATSLKQYKSCVRGESVLQAI